MKALALIVCSPVIVPVAVAAAFLGVARVAVRHWRAERAEKDAAERHRADLRAELARQRVKLAEGVKRPWGWN